ncbi:MAG: CPBP family glutamic-type intramembrane protease [Candidatus Promineifilaceae bacterium]
MTKDSPTFTSSPVLRVLLALVLPLIGSLLFSAAVVSLTREQDTPTSALPLAGAGLVAWFLGLNWYRIPGMGLRGHRALYAGIGFAVLGWLAFFIVRFATVAGDIVNAPNSGRTFVYLLLFEAFCAQLWAFGLFFHAVADWRGPLTAAFSSGILFGTIAFLLFDESFGNPALPAFLYFSVWGILYGIIRLRTGSILGVVIVQALQSWTGWQLLAPVNQPDPSQLGNLYLITAILYLIVIWRLWPKQEDDYRV